MAQGHLPDDNAAPVVATEDRFLHAELIQKAGHVVGEVRDVIVLDRVWTASGAVTSLIGGDHPAAGVGQGLELVAPRKGQLRKAMAQDDGDTGPGTRLVVGEPDAVDVGVLHGGHLDGGCGHGTSG